MIELLTGKNHFQIEHIKNTKISEHESEYGKESVVLIDAAEKEWNDIHQAIDGMSLFGPENRLIIIRGITQNTDALNRLNDMVEHINSSVYLLVLEPTIDKRSVFYKTIKKEGLVTDCPELDEFKLAQWVEQEADRLGSSISSSDAKYLVNRVGNSQLRLSSEVDKLSIHSENISRESIELLTEQKLEETIFELLEKVVSGRQEQAMKTYQNLRDDRIEPVYVLTMIGWQLHILLAVSFAGSKSDQEIAKSAKLSPYAISKTRRILRSINKQTLTQMVTAAADTDSAIKQGRAKADPAVVALILRIAYLNSKK